MCLKAVVGMAWGDEGKGRLTDELAKNAVAVARFCGANNAGHGLELDGKRFCTTILPSGVLQSKKLLIGPGVCTDPTILIQEIDLFEKAGYTVDLMVDPRTPVTLPHHRQRDGANERMRGAEGVGSVGFGAGYSQADRINRLSVRFGDLLHPDLLAKRIKKSYDQATPILKAIYSEDLDTSIEEVIDVYTGLGSILAPYIGDVSAYVNRMLGLKKTILCESSQGALLDLDYGTWPHTTGSNVGPGRIFTGLGIPSYPVETVGVIKAFSSRAGWGPFPTKSFPEVSANKHIIEKGNQYEIFPEYSEVSVRPLDVGWLDLVALRHTVSTNLHPGDYLALTHLDTMAGLPKVSLATEYRYDTGLSETPCFMQAEPFKPLEVKYHTMPGWEELGEIKKEEDLPINARKFVDFVEYSLNRDIRYLSFSPNRGDLIDRWI